MAMNFDEIHVILSFFRTCVYEGLLPRTKKGMGRFCVFLSAMRYNGIMNSEDDMMRFFEFGNEQSNLILIQMVDRHSIKMIDSEVDLIRQLSGRDDFRLIACQVEDWNRDLSPWEAPPVFGKESFGGRAEETLRELRESVIEQFCGENRIILGGYIRDLAVMRKTDTLVIEDPDIFRCIGETDIDKTYEMPKSAVTYRKPRNISKEQREEAKERINII